jgi:hypothetical protein
MCTATGRNLQVQITLASHRVTHHALLIEQRCGSGDEVAADTIRPHTARRLATTDLKKR